MNAESPSTTLVYAGGRGATARSRSGRRHPFASVRRGPPLRIVAALIGILVSAGGSAAGDGPAADEAVLSLADGWVVGRLLESSTRPEAGPTLRWQSPTFVDPLEFPLGVIRAVTLGRSGTGGDSTAGARRIELVGGDRLVGRLESIDAERIRVTLGPASDPTPVSVRREGVTRIEPASGGASAVWSGGFEDVTLSSEAAWKREGRGVANVSPRATLWFAAGDSPRARYDVALAWNGEARARLGFSAVAAADRPAPFRVELDRDGIVAIRDECDDSGGGSADLQPCGPVPEGGARLAVFVDRVAGRLVVVPAGATDPVADLTLPPAGVGADAAACGVRIEVLAGTVTLESLRVSSWGGATLDDDSGAGIRLADGRAIAGIVTALERGATDATILPAGADPESQASRRIPLERIAAIRFSSVAAEPSVAAPGRIAVADRSGSTLTGTFVRVDDGGVWIDHPWIEGTLGIPLASVASLDAGASAAPAELPGRVGRLEWQGGSLAGCLAESPVGGDGGRIAWQPRGSLTAGVIASDASGALPMATIVYVAAEPDEPGGGTVGGVGAFLDVEDGSAHIRGVFPGGPLERTGVSQRGIDAVAPRGDGRFVDVTGLAIPEVSNLLLGRAGSEVQIRLAAGGGDDAREVRVVRESQPLHGGHPPLDEIERTHARLLAIHAGPPPVAEGAFAGAVVLVDGDRIPCRVDLIDESGVRVHVEGCEPVTIPSADVAAVELVRSESGSLTPEKFRSLTTLPRSQRYQPPTHLVRSWRGDYLRGRVVAMNDGEIRLAVEGAPKGRALVIPREEVARVIWLHPEELDDAWRPPPGEATAAASVGILAGDATRLWMTVRGVESGGVTGDHPVLGTVRVDVGAVDRILLGRRLEDSPRAIPYAKWRMQPASEPRNLPPRRPAAGPAR